LQPRFHLEIGLVRLVQAGRLLPIEEALAGLPAASPAGSTGAANPAAAPTPRPIAAPAPPPRIGPSPFELDRAKKAASRPPEPQSSGANALAAEPAPIPMAAGDPRQLLHAYLSEQGMAHLADAVENAGLTVAGADLNIVAPKSYALYFKDRAFETAVRTVFGRPLRVNLTAGEAAPQSAALPQSAAAKGPADEDEATTRALANPEVRRFREVFGGEIRKVRNLKE
jgi:DNA polymerase-3 subunit gamma/tau